MTDIATRVLGYGMMAVSIALFGWIFYRRSVSIGRTGWGWLMHAAWVWVAFGFVSAAAWTVVYKFLPVYSVEIGPSGDPIVQGPVQAVQLLLGLVSNAVAIGAAYVVAPLVLRASHSPVESTSPLGAGLGRPQPTSGVFVFNYNDMASEYGHQAFVSIQAALGGTRGTCLFCDGDVSTTGVAGLAKGAAHVVPAGSDSPLLNPDLTPQGFGPYLAAMWTDLPSNFQVVHDVLRDHGGAGYLGHMTLAGVHDPSDFQQMMGRQLQLPQGYLFVDGTVQPGTNKYGT